jgi:PAS domain S-box-containing protein
MRNHSSSELEKELAAVKKELEHFKRISKESGIARLREAEELSLLIQKLKQTEKALQQSKDELELRVEERTAELVFVTGQLKSELAQKKQAEKELLFKENIIKSSSSVIATCELEGKMTYGNPAFLKVWGFESPDEFLGRSFKEFWIVDSRLDEIMQALRGKGTWFGEIQARRKDGTLFDVRVSAATVYDRLGNAVALTSTSIDITDRKQTEEALRESEEKYRRLFEMESDAIFLVRKDDGQIMEVNTAATRLYGFGREELLNMKNTDLSVEPDETRKATTEEKIKIPIRYHRKRDGSVFPVEITASHFTWKGRDVHVAAIRDISLRIEAEKEKFILEEKLRQTYKMEAIGTLTGGIAHDFNNILGIIIGNAELALDDVPSWNPTYKCIEEIKASGLRAASVVRQLLSFIRKTDIKRQPVGMIGVVKDALTFMRSTISTHINIRQNMQSAADTVLADPTQIKQVMINLCTNASQALEDDGGVLDIGIQNVLLDKDSANLIDPELIPGNYVRVTVSDNGPGIDPESIERIFDPYYTTRGVGKGSGLGLSVVHGIVKIHGGAITVDSELGMGTTFSLYFPVAEEKVEIASETVDEWPKGHEKILFIDDEKSIVKMTRQILERLGYQVETQTNPVDALEMFRSDPNRFDLVITDMAMPQMTGDRLAKEILNIHPEIPIIICSGYSAKVSEENVAKLGARAFALKPLGKHNLAVTVRKVLDGN